MWVSAFLIHYLTKPYHNFNLHLISFSTFVTYNSSVDITSPVGHHIGIESVVLFIVEKYNIPAVSLPQCIMCFSTEFMS